MVYFMIMKENVKSKREEKDVHFKEMLKQASQRDFKINSSQFENLELKFSINLLQSY